MSIVSLKPFTQFNTTSLFRSASDPHGDSVRLRKLNHGKPYKAPSYLYLIYISMDKDGLIVRHFQGGINSNKIKSEEDNFIRQARKGPGSINNLPTIEFKCACYFTVVLDKENWDFYYPDAENPEPDYKEAHDPLVFLDRKAYLIEDPTNPGKWVKIDQSFAMNRAFYDAERHERKVDGDPIVAVRCINFLTKNAAGDPLNKKEDQDFGFNILVRIPFSGSPNEKVTLIIDPDGQNQGPRTA